MEHLLLHVQLVLHESGVAELVVILGECEGAVRSVAHNKGKELFIKLPLLCICNLQSYNKHGDQL